LTTSRVWPQVPRLAALRRKTERLMARLARVGGDSGRPPFEAGRFI